MNWTFVFSHHASKMAQIKAEDSWLDRSRPQCKRPGSASLLFELVLAARGWHHHQTCTLCNGTMKNMASPLICLLCPFAQEIWMLVLAQLNMPFRLKPTSLDSPTLQTGGKKQQPPFQRSKGETSTESQSTPCGTFGRSGIEAYLRVLPLL